MRLSGETSQGIVRRHPFSRSVVVLSPAGEPIRLAHAEGFAEVAWVVNPDPDCEQIDSLACALETLRELDESGGFFIQPVDFPLATKEDYAALGRSFLEDTAARVDVFKPRPRGGARHGHPILCRRRVLERFTEAARRGFTARDVIREAETSSVDVDNPDLARDMDHPEDYGELLEIYRSRGGGASGRRSC